MGQDIAIIGLACRLPGAPTPQAYWDLLCKGHDAISRFDDSTLERAGTPRFMREQPNFVPAAGVLPDIDRFDAAFFGIPAQEAAFLDPQHRIFLECVWEALEDAGCPPTAAMRDIGVFAGASLNAYLIRNLACRPELLSTPEGFMSLIGNEKDYLATRVAYKLDLHGPAITVQTACSTSLVAVHLAMQSLLLGECDVAVAGGVSVKVPQEGGYLHQEGMPFSKDGRCRPFDAEGTGTVFGSGAGVVVLKCLDAAIEDGDDIYAVIRGSACNNDGNRKVGFTAPSVDGQLDAIRRALDIAECPASRVDYIETHGTATPLGDPIEVAALMDAYGGDPKAGPCLLGSVKSNFGHMETAAGVAGLIKVALMLKHRQFVPSLGFEKPNPHIPFAGTRFAVATDAAAWQSPEGWPRCASLSSFGMGGTNVHMVLEEAPVPVHEAVPERPFTILPLSARSADALQAGSQALHQWLSAQPGTPIDQVAACIQTRRAQLEQRQALVCTDTQDALTALASQPERLIRGQGNPAYRAPVAFLYCGGGAQYPGMARELRESEPVFRQAFDHCVQRFTPLIGHDLQQYIEVAPEQLADKAEQMQCTDLMFPLLFSVQYAMSQLLTSWGVQPDLVMGHSNGEYAAAVVAKVMDVDTAIELVAARSMLMKRMPEGSMVSVPLPVEAVLPFAERFRVSIGAENAPGNTAISGEVDCVTAARKAIEEELKVECRVVHVRAGLHSSLTRGIAAAFEGVVREHRFDPPQVPWISTVTGTFMDPQQAPETAYWVRHLCQTVKFQAAAETLLSQREAHVMVDMGPGRVVSDLMRQNAQGKPLQIAHMSRSHSESSKDSFSACTALARLWTWHQPVDWLAFQGGERPAKLDLPAYAWQRKRHWIEARSGGDDTAGPQLTQWRDDTAANEPANDGEMQRPGMSTPYAAPQTDTETRLLGIWQAFFGIQAIGVLDSFVELGGTSLLATQVLARINSEFASDLTLGTFLDLGHVSAIARELDAMTLARDERLLAEALSEIEGALEGAVETVN